MSKMENETLNNIEPSSVNVEDIETGGINVACIDDNNQLVFKLIPTNLVAKFICRFGDIDVPAVSVMIPEKEIDNFLSEV